MVNARDCDSMRQTPSPDCTASSPLSRTHERTVQLQGCNIASRQGHKDTEIDEARRTTRNPAAQLALMRLMFSLVRIIISFVMSGP